MDKISNIGLSRLMSSVYDFHGLTEQEIWCHIAQKINIIIEHFNYIDNKINNEIDKNKIKFEYLLGEGLNEQVAKELLKKFNDGTLSNLINNTVLKEINDKVDLIYLSNRSIEINILMPPLPLKGCDMTGKSDSTERLKNILKYACDTYNHVNIIIPNGEILISDMIDIDVEKISITCQGIIKCDLSTEKYALRFGYTGANEGIYNKGRSVYKGLYLVNKNHTSKIGNGILFAGTTETVGSSNIHLVNCIVKDFTNGLTYGDRSYLVRCNNCDLYNNIVQINIIGGYDTGENIRFDSCVIANGGTALVCNNDLATVFLNGCSIDYNYKQILNIKKGDIYIDNCHIEHDGNHFNSIPPFEMHDHDGNKVTINNSRIIFIERNNATTMEYIIKNHYYNNAMSYFNIINCFLQGFKTTTGYIGTGLITMYNNQCYQWNDMAYKLSYEMNKINDGKFFNADLNVHQDFIKIKEPNNVEISAKYDRTTTGDNWLMMKKKTVKGTNGSCGFIVPRSLLSSLFGGEMTLCSNKNANIDIRLGTCRYLNGKICNENLRYNVGQILIDTTPTTHKFNNRQFSLADVKNDYLFMEIIMYNCEADTEIYIKNMELYEF